MRQLLPSIIGTLISLGVFTGVYYWISKLIKSYVEESEKKQYKRILRSVYLFLVICLLVIFSINTTNIISVNEIQHSTINHQPLDDASKSFEQRIAHDLDTTKNQSK